MYPRFQTRYQRNFNGYIFLWSSFPSDNTMRPNRKWKNPRWWPLNFKCMYLRFQTKRYRRNSNGYTYTFWGLVIQRDWWESCTTKEEVDYPWSNANSSSPRQDMYEFPMLQPLHQCFGNLWEYCATKLEVENSKTSEFQIHICIVLLADQTLSYHIVSLPENKLYSLAFAKNCVLMTNVCGVSGIGTSQIRQSAGGSSHPHSARSAAVTWYTSLLPTYCSSWEPFVPKRWRTMCRANSGKQTYWNQHQLLLFFKCMKSERYIDDAW